MLFGFGIRKVKRKDPITTKKLKGIAQATTAGAAALIRKYKLPEEEALNVFTDAYAGALADSVGADPEVMFKEPLEKFRKKPPL